MINFFYEGIYLKVQQVRKTKTWLKNIAQQEGFLIGDLNYIFCSDDHILKVNQEYLNHDFYTDIITFDNSESDLHIEGDIFVSIDRVKENAITLNQPYETELKRVLAHGILHLTGYGDLDDDQEKLMRQKEDFYLAQFNQQ